MTKIKRPNAAPDQAKANIMSVLQPYRGLVFLLILMALLSNGLNLVLPWLIARGIDAYGTGTLVLPRLILEFSAAAAIIFIITYLQSIIQTYASEKVALELRNNLAARISRQNYVYIQQVNPSKLLTNLTADVDSVKLFVSQAIVSIASSLFIIIGASILLLTINWKLGLVVLIIIPVIGITFFTVLRKVRVLFMKGREVIDQLNKTINESVLGAALIRVLNAQQQQYDRFITSNGESRSLGMATVRLFAGLVPIITFMASMAYLAVLVMGGHFVITNSMSLGNLAAFNSYISLLIFPIVVIGFMSNLIAQATASYKRISEVLYAPEVPDSGTVKDTLRGDVKLDKISLTLGGKPVLKEVSFFAKAGSRTAIIGPTAAGKTQLLNLMIGLLKPSSGTMAYDNTLLDDYDKDALLQQVGLVFQDSIIFNMSVRENIAFNENVSPALMEKAIQTAELKEFIANLPEGLETIVSERGASLSGGQKQRIMLARALALNPQVLLLDDFTARVDTNTEQRILENVQQNYPHLTLISVTQKIASAASFDQIILLMEGEIVAAGTHDELMQGCPEYIQIYNSQRSTSNYELHLNKIAGGPQQKTSTGKALKKLLPYLAPERKYLIAAFFVILVTSGLNLTSPFLIGHAIDDFVQTKEYGGILRYAGILLLMSCVALCSSYIQTRLMGGVGQRMLYSLRNAVFVRLQELPIAFFNQNKTGDLISRINNDTDKLNQFFAQSLVQFIGGIATMTGAGIFLLSINPRLGAATLAPGLLLLIFTRLISPWVKKKNADNLKSTGGMSAEIQESLNNFKVIIAFNRRDYFRKRFAVANDENYKTAIGAGLANNLFMPVFSLCANLAQLSVLAYGIYLVISGEFTVGLLISYLSYSTYFYNPIRQLAALWTTFQVAMAGWDRISQILQLESDLTVLPATGSKDGNALISFRRVNFRYPDGKEILHNISFDMEAGKTYALVGPTGGGKTTTASLIARLYDATEGSVLLNGRDIRSYTPEERTQQIGFILQEPFLFSGTIRENIIFGNSRYMDYTADELLTVMEKAGLHTLLERFEEGLDTKVSSSGDSVSLGQKQLIAFMRAVLRDPALLVLDEATANIDTITEQLLEDILQKLPAHTTRVIIAHRLNTIENADEIFFVNAGEITRAGSFDHAMNMLLQHERNS